LNFIYWTDNPEFFIRLTIFTVIVANAFAMQYRKISMWVGPVLAGGSWYAYFFFTVWIETESTYTYLLFGYIAWLSIVGLFLTLFRIYLTRKQKSDLGDGISGRRDYEATKQEWRTAPLWGIGVTETVNGHTNYLHDGRARNVEEAILWHGGEAETAKQNYMRLTKKERQLVINFINNL